MVVLVVPVDLGLDEGRQRERRVAGQKRKQEAMVEPVEAAGPVAIL